MYPLDEIESKYRSAISIALEGKDLTGSLLVELSLNLYKDLKVKDISDDMHSDALLYQYGVYNWHDEHGRHFALDITRQFQHPSSYEPYQLSFSLIYDPAPFENAGYHERWSMDFGDLEGFKAHIMSTDGYTIAENHVPKAYSIRFNQC